MIADMHRARQLAWELPKLGWDVEILSAATSYQVPTYIEDDADAFFPPDTPLHFAAERYKFLFRLLAVNNVALRAVVPIRSFARRLLAEKKFDVVYISTAKWPLYLAGTGLQREFKVPVVVDLHDPFYSQKSYSRWDWARLKYEVSASLAKVAEPCVARLAAGVVSVSPQYLEAWRARYGRLRASWLGFGRNAVIPFAAVPQDFAMALAEKEPALANQGARGRIVYVGVGGPIMARAFSLICRAVDAVRRTEPALTEGVRIELYGTRLDRRLGEPLDLAEAAREAGVGDLVTEYPERISFRRSLELLLSGDGALVLGVDSAGYMPSKLFSYALSGKPLLASLRRDGPAYAQLEATPGLGLTLWFDDAGEMPLSEASEIMGKFLAQVKRCQRFDRTSLLAPHLSASMAQRHLSLFEACLRDARA